MNIFANVPIQQLVDTVANWNPLKAEAEGVFTYIDLSAVDQDTKSIVAANEVACTEAPSRARQLVASGDVLVSTVRPNLNGVALVPDELDGATASTGFCVIRPKPSQLDSRYIYHWVRSPAFISEMVSLATGASYPAVSDKIVLGSRIPLPPLPEQRRIAAILDQADALRTQRREALAQLDRLTQAIFVEMFGAHPDEHPDWTKVQLSEVAETVTGFAFPSGEYVEEQVNAVRLCRGTNVLPSRFDWSDTAWWPENKISGLDAFKLEAGDIVMAMDRPWISEGFKINRIAQQDCPCLLVQRVTRVRGGKRASTGYIYHLLKQPAFTHHCKPTETTVPHISPKEIRSFEFRLPPASMQEAFLQKIAVVETLAAKSAAALADCNALFASLQHRAFAGEL